MNLHHSILALRMKKRETEVRFKRASQLNSDYHYYPVVTKHIVCWMWQFNGLDVAAVSKLHTTLPHITPQFKCLPYQWLSDKTVLEPQWWKYRQLPYGYFCVFGCVIWRVYITMFAWLDLLGTTCNRCCATHVYKLNGLLFRNDHSL